MKGDWPECPSCPGEELINADRPGYYECGYCDRKYPVSDFEKPQSRAPRAQSGPAHTEQQLFERLGLPYREPWEREA